MMFYFVSHFPLLNDSEFSQCMNVCGLISAVFFYSFSILSLLFSQFFQPTLGQIVRQKLSEGRKVIKHILSCTLYVVVMCVPDLVLCLL